MLYLASKQIAFVMPPRTGSTTLTNLLLGWGFEIANGNKHSKPTESTVDFSQYRILGFYRDPLDRFLSLLRHMQQKYGTWDKVITDFGLSADELKALNYDQLVDLFPKYENTFPFYFHKQVDWHANAELFDFANYNTEVLRIARIVDVNQVFISVTNDTKKTDEVPSQKVIDFVQSYYADDYRLGRERGLLV